jgi:hypothetical protein
MAMITALAVALVALPTSVGAEDEWRTPDGGLVTCIVLARTPTTLAGPVKATEVADRVRNGQLTFRVVPCPKRPTVDELRGRGQDDLSTDWLVISEGGEDVLRARIRDVRQDVSLREEPFTVEPPEGRVYLSVLLEYEALADMARYGPTDWQAFVGDRAFGGRTYVGNALEPELAAGGTLPAGRTATGWVIFEVPPRGEVRLLYDGHHRDDAAPVVAELVVPRPKAGPLPKELATKRKPNVDLRISGAFDQSVKHYVPDLACTWDRNPASRKLRPTFVSIDSHAIEGLESTVDQWSLTLSRDTNYRHVELMLVVDGPGILFGTQPWNRQDGTDSLGRGDLTASTKGLMKVDARLQNSEGEEIRVKGTVRCPRP